MYCKNSFVTLTETRSSYQENYPSGGKRATFENSAGRKTVELYASLEISRGAESDALVRSQHHRIRRHGLIMNLAVRAGKYPTVFHSPTASAQEAPVVRMYSRSRSSPETR